MDPQGGRAAAGTAIVVEGSSSLIPPNFDAAATWQINDATMESGPYPERAGEPDCAYYIRTGLCRFGMTCKFNHPPNRKLAITRIKGGYPERVGQPECQFYIKTGTCKFGATCKFHHPREKAGIAGRVQLNILGYPLRPDEKECAYYLRTGLCKFGNTCKFHHPQPSNAMVSLRGSPVYPPVHSPTTMVQQSYPGGLANWPRASFISPRWQGPSSYAQLVVPQGLVQVPSWAYSGQVTSVSSPESRQQIPVAGQFYSSSRPSEAPTGSQGTVSTYRPGSIPAGLHTMQRESVFPERPDQPECQFYMKTGDCKFGAVCKFHHPRERLVPIPNCALSPMGLPLRPGEPICLFYSRYGICKFGPNCKFDHPVGTFTYSPPTSSTADVPVVRRLMGSSSRQPPLTLSSEQQQFTSSDENIEA